MHLYQPIIKQYEGSRFPQSSQKVLFLYVSLCETDIENSGVNETRKQHGWVCALELALLAPFIVQFFHSQNAVNFPVIQFPPINFPSFKSGLTNKLICGKFRMAPDL